MSQKERAAKNLPNLVAGTYADSNVRTYFDLKRPSNLKHNHYYKAHPHSSFLLYVIHVCASIHSHLVVPPYPTRPTFNVRWRKESEILCLHGYALHRIACSSISFKFTLHSLCISLYIISARIHCNAWLNGSSPPPRHFTARICISPSCLVSFVGTTVSGDSSCCIPSLNGCRSRSFRTRSFASCSFWYKVCCLCFVVDKGMNLCF